MAHLLLRLELVKGLLRRLGRWWLDADFRNCQLPILVLALGVWAISARAAWQSQESATPLLRESISQIRQAQARANAGVVTPPSTGRRVAAASAPAVPQPAEAGSESVAPSTSHPDLSLQKPVKKTSGSFAGVLLASINAWFSPEPAAPEEVKGNPQKRVWVDLKTGLYYCPGADYYGYGGAQRGKVMSQRNAEYEYFQPATGAPCQ